jgi:hypothetical protein
MLIAAVLVSAPVALAAASGCDEGEAPPEAGPAETGSQLVTLTLSRPETPPVRFDFDNFRGSSDHTVSVRASPALPPDAQVTAEVEGDLYRADGGDTFPAEAVFLQQPRVARGGGFVRFSICLDAGIENVEDGRYIGTVQLTGPLVETTAIPIEATLRAPRLYAIAAIGFGLLMGLLLKMAGDLRKEPGASVRGYVGRTEFAYAGLVGIVVAVVSYVQLYESSDVWGTGQDWLKLAMVGIAAQVTGMTAVDIVKPFKP